MNSFENSTFSIVSYTVPREDYYVGMYEGMFSILHLGACNHICHNCNKNYWSFHHFSLLTVHDDDALLR